MELCHLPNTVNDAIPEVPHKLLFAGWVPIVTGEHVKVTVTVTVKVAPVAGT